MDRDTETDDTILVPIANVETAERQLDTAIDLALERSARILLVYVLEVPPQLSLVDGRRYLLDEEIEELLEEAAAMVETAGLRVDQRIRISRDVARGIVGTIEDHDVDTVLMGWRGRPPRQDYVLGNRLDRVLKRAECDVLVKRIQTPSPEIESVLVPVAGGPHDAFGAETAVSLARRNDATVHLLHVRSAVDPGLSRSEAMQLLREVVPPEAGPEIERELIERADVASAITDRTTDHDLTVLGVSRGNLLRRTLLGTISEAVARHAAGTVMLAKRYEPVPSRLRRLFD